MPKLEVTLGIGVANAKQYDTLEIDEDEWDDCETKEQQEDLIDFYATEWANGYIDIGAQIIEEQ